MASSQEPSPALKVKNDPASKMSSSRNGGGDKTTAEAGKTKKSSKIKELWGKLDLDVGTVLIMMKYVQASIGLLQLLMCITRAALPPTISLAM
jgi:hypothetical protein